MKSFVARAAAATGFAAGLFAAIVHGQSSAGSGDVHVQAARKAAGQEYQGIFTSTCGALNPAPRTAPAAPRQPGPPPRESWYAEPAKVFGNLYFLGQTEYSAWAVTTSQ